MRWLCSTPILVLALVLAQCTWMKFSALVARLTSLTALEALLSAVIQYAHMQEYDAKVNRNFIKFLSRKRNPLEHHVYSLFLQ